MIFKYDFLKLVHEHCLLSFLSIGKSFRQRSTLSNAPHRDCKYLR